jgi:hypothetical protein
VNAEAGAIIAMIRSSLDMLVVTLAQRNGHVRSKDVYFPIARSESAFFDAKTGAVKKIRGLAHPDRIAIEKLKP